MPRRRRTPDSSATTKLAALRTARGYVQLEMADLTGISPASYWRLEHNQLAAVPLRQLARLTTTR